MLHKKIVSQLYQFAHRFGIDIRRFPARDHRVLLKYLRENDVENCFDVGANTGQFAKLLRSSGFKGNIYSFEPQKQAFDKLSRRAGTSSKWTVYNIGLGDKDCKSIINISKNSVSSSILEINKSLTAIAPETDYVSTQEIEVKMLDTFIREIKFEKKLFLKIDAQGFESKILEGVENYFDNIYAIQIELSCVSLYEGEKLFDEMKVVIETKGFYISSLESGFADPKTGRLLQVEAIFLRDTNNK